VGYPDSSISNQKRNEPDRSLKSSKDHVAAVKIGNAVICFVCWRWGYYCNGL